MSSIAMMRAAASIYGRVRPRSAAGWARRLFMTPRRLPAKPWEQAVEERAVRDRLQVGWSCLRWGTGGGPRVLCMHGWEGRATQFDPLARSLARTGATVVAIDAPGHGASPEREAHPIAFARSILDAHYELGPFDLVVGHSMGAGAVGIALAWGVTAERVVLLASPSSMSGVLDRFARFIGLPGAAHDGFRELVEQCVGFSTHEVDVARLVRGIEVPALVFQDRADLEVPFTDGAEIADCWPSATLVPVEGMGHRRLLRDPAVIERIVEFVPGRVAADRAIPGVLSAI